VTPRLLGWVADSLGTTPRELSIEPMSGGLTSVMHVVRDVRRGGEHVLRVMTVEPWATHAEAMIAREAATQRQLHGGALPVPRCVAVDPAGERSGAPVLLMTRLPGQPLLDRGTDYVLRCTAETLVLVHATRVTEAERPRGYQSWAGAGPWPVPSWARDPGPWERAAALAGGPEPSFEGTFLHRDYNPGNLLWSGLDTAAPSISGVVDWVETSWGPRDLDVAHCAKYLAMLHGADAAERFVHHYQDGGGRLAASAAARAYWTALAVLALRGPERGLAFWRHQGLTDVPMEAARARLEEHLARALAPV